MTADQKRERIDYLTKNGCPTDIAPRAVDALATLTATNAGVLHSQDPDLADYFFFQGFIAGYMTQTHYN